jgi:hypothetical protein
MEESRVTSATTTLEYLIGASPGSETSYCGEDARSLPSIHNLHATIDHILALNVGSRLVIVHNIRSFHTESLENRCLWTIFR